MRVGVLVPGCTAVAAAAILEVPSPFTIEPAIDLDVVREAFRVALPVVAYVDIERRPGVVFVDVQILAGNGHSGDGGSVVPVAQIGLDTAELQLEIATLDGANHPVVAVGVELDGDAGDVPASLFERAHDLFAHFVERELPGRRVKERNTLGHSLAFRLAVDVVYTWTCHRALPKLVYFILKPFSSQFDCWNKNRL